MRVTVVTHKRAGKVLKVAEDWKTASRWVDDSDWDEDDVTLTGAAVLEA